MRIRRAILIPAILALGVAGSALTGVSAVGAATQAPTMHYHGSMTVAPLMHYHG